MIYVSLPSLPPSTTNPSRKVCLVRTVGDVCNMWKMLAFMSVQRLQSAGEHWFPFCVVQSLLCLPCRSILTTQTGRVLSRMQVSIFIHSLGLRAQWKRSPWNNTQPTSRRYVLVVPKCYFLSYFEMGVLIFTIHVFIWVVNIIWLGTGNVIGVSLMTFLDCTHYFTVGFRF